MCYLHLQSPEHTKQHTWYCTVSEDALKLMTLHKCMSSDKHISTDSMTRLSPGSYTRVESWDQTFHISMEFPEFFLNFFVLVVLGLCLGVFFLFFFWFIVLLDKQTVLLAVHRGTTLFSFLWTEIHICFTHLKFHLPSLHNSKDQMQKETFSIYQFYKSDLFSGMLIKIF